MRTPDVRQRILEHVIELAARKGVEDVELIVATALHRRMTSAEIRRAVGERVFRSFWPDQLYNFDAEDPQAPARDRHAPTKGELVEISKRAAESDLIVYVNINLVAMDGGHKSVAVGLAGYRSLKHHHNVDTMLHSQVVHGPARGPQRDQRLGEPDGPRAAATAGEDLPDRDHAELRDVPVEPRLPEQARVGVERVRPGPDDGGQEGERPRAAAHPPRVLPADRGALQADRRQRRRGRGRARAHARRTCTASSSSR